MKKTGLILLSALILAGCSTTRVLNEGECRLAKNTVTVSGDPSFKTSEITPYIKQQPNKYILFGWNPFLYVYNWSGKSDKGINRFFRKIGAAPVVYDQALSDMSVSAIEEHLRYIGYYGSDVRCGTVTKNRKTKVNYDITLGKRYSIDSIFYSLPPYDNFGKDFSADLGNSIIKVGKYLSEKDLEAESLRSASYMKNCGFYNFSKGNYFFTADTLGRRGGSVLDYQIRSYSRNENEQTALPLVRYSFGKVSVTRPESLKFREERIKYLNLIIPGEYYSDDVINATYSRLSSQKIFSSVDIVVTPDDSLNTVDCDIILKESKPKGVKFNLEAFTSSNGLFGISPQVNFYHKNLFHGGEVFNMGVTGNLQSNPSKKTHANEFGASLGLELPHAMLKVNNKHERRITANLPRTLINSSFNYQDRPEYRRTMLSFSLAQNGYLGRRISYQITPLRINAVSMSNLSESFQEILNKNPLLAYSFQDHLNAGISATLLQRTNTEVVPKTAYRTVRVAVDLSGNLLSLFKNGMKRNANGEALIFNIPFAQYFRSEASFAGAFRFGASNGQSLAGRLFAGIGFAYGNSTVMPYEEQFYCGGAGSMRGWNARSLGPGSEPASEAFSIPSQTGNFKLEADLEYRFKMFWKLEGALFAEVGNVWNKDNVKEFYKTLGADWGLGLRINLDLILLRLDLGLKLHDPSSNSGLPVIIGPDKWFRSGGYAIHFGVGYPF